MNTLLQIASLFAAVPEIEGRKKLQKMVHILQSFGVPFGVTYGYHHYGPFSEQLQDCLQTAQHDALLKETAINGQFPTSSFSAEPRLQNLNRLFCGNTLPHWAEFARALNEHSPRDLETISTLIYLENLYGGPLDSEKITKEFVSLKPQLESRLAEARETLAEFRRTFKVEQEAA